MDKKYIYLISTPILILSIFIIISSLLSSGDRNKDLKAFVEKAQNQEILEVDDLPIFNEVPIVKYDPGTGRSPFDKSSSQQVHEETQEKHSVPSALEQYPIASLKLVGVIEDTGKLWAILETPDGKAFRAGRGDRVGLRRLQIVEITQDEIVMSAEQDSLYDQSKLIHMHFEQDEKIVKVGKEGK